MEHKSLLKALGGEHAVCKALAEKGVLVAAVTVRAWALPGRTIPAKYWAHVKAIADDVGVPLTFEEFTRSVAVPTESEGQAA